MDKQILEPMSGFRDYNRPTKDWVIFQLRSLFLRFGYQPLETPSLEKQEILLGKMGDEAQKLLYLFEDNGGRKIGLRYDLTVPLSRFVAGNYQNLALPFKRFEIGNSWRAERAQKGRLRQFVQADIDIVGDSGTVASEMELLQVARMASQKLEIDWTCLMNDRGLVKDVFDVLKIEEDARAVLLMVLDKKDKLEPKELHAELKRVSISDVQLRQILDVFLDEETALEKVEQLVGESESLARLKTLLTFADSIKLKAKFAPYMVRGLDYYTGIIFECFSADFPRSLAAGGRYDSLVESLIGEKLPAVGISFGVDNIVDAMADRETMIDTRFVLNLPETELEADLWVETLRENGENVERYLDSSAALGKQIKYADKRGYKEIIIPFEDEWKQGSVVIKNLATGDQQTVKRESI